MLHLFPMQTPSGKEPQMMVHLNTVLLLVIALLLAVIVIWGTNAV